MSARVTIEGYKYDANVIAAKVMELCSSQALYLSSMERDGDNCTIRLELTDDDREPGHYTCEECGNLIEGAEYDHRPSCPSFPSPPTFQNGRERMEAKT